METNRFIIKEIFDKESREIIIKNKITGEYLTVLPEAGARLKEMVLENAGSYYPVLKKVESLEFKNLDDLFLNTKLSPFASRIVNGIYNHNDKEYQLPLNYTEEKNACHGFVYNSIFEVVGKDINDVEASCTLRFDYNNIYEGYPYNYTLLVTYKLQAKGGVVFRTEVVNNSDNEMPLSDGWHHYFILGDNINKLRIETGSMEKIELNNRLIPTGKTEAFNNFNELALLGESRFDNCFRLHRNGEINTVKLYSEEKNVTLNIWQQTGENKYNYIVIYTPVSRDSIAVEPMSSNVNAFNNKEGLVVLKPGNKFEAEFGVYLT